MAFTAFKLPGILTAFPFSSFTGFPFSNLARPASLTSKAMALALRVDVVFRFTLYATKKSLAPITVAPRLASNSAGP